MNSDMTPSEILERMTETYATCSTYQDSGSVIDADDGRQRFRCFSTAFVRPDRFLFEFQKSYDGVWWDKLIIAQNASKVQKWWDVEPGVEELDSVASGLAAAAGVSGGSSSKVPPMLTPEFQRGVLFKLLKDLERLGDSSVDGADCFRVQGFFYMKNPPRRLGPGSFQTASGDADMTHEYVLDIDKASFLLRRIEIRYVLRGRDVKTIISYKPIIDAEVPEERLIRPTGEEVSLPRTAFMQS